MSKITVRRHSDLDLGLSKALRDGHRVVVADSGGPERLKLTARRWLPQSNLIRFEATP
ncbi:hypothetical protein [Brevundimonas sp. FT23028]|uniref:hypothetical protein n=1 Tax=Brevundimonas sp. FT23028 TaxID=3393748 RepID=UPI003B5868C1